MLRVWLVIARKSRVYSPQILVYNQKNVVVGSAVAIAKVGVALVAVRVMDFVLCAEDFLILYN
jgi:hypothetical protein